ncbi:MAG: thioredoxin family protein [Planctomycetota bacterium]|nr:thioredoxin family protein [Planctomycetota bacterium]
MKKYALLLLALAVIGAGALAGGSGWQTDFEKALKKAAKSERPMLVEFTDGEASKEINKGLFYTPKFKAWAKKKVVLVELNYGKRLNKKLAEQYETLKVKYKVEQFPTLLLVSHEGKLLGKLPAFRKGAQKAWLTEAGDVLEAASGAGKWLTDYAAAKKISKRTRKPMLLDFNGSDW